MSPRTTITEALALADENVLTTDRDAAALYITAALEAGLEPIPLVPNTKKPSITEWTTATITEAIWAGWLDTAYADRTAADHGTPALGVGFRTNPRRLMVSDYDTPAAGAGWVAHLRRMGMDTEAEPTVKSPGTTDGRHHGGGHTYIEIPEGVVLPADLPKVISVDQHGVAHATKGDSRFDLMIHDVQVVAPGTVREPGIYTVAGPVQTATPELIEWLTAQAAAGAAKAAEKAERKAQRMAEGAPTAEWQDRFEAENDWSDILTPAGWTVAGADTCGCETWLRPGSTADRSGIAHDCAEHGTYFMCFTSGAGEMGLEEGRPYTKIQMQAAVRYGSPEGAALAKAMTDAGGPDNGGGLSLESAARMAALGFGVTGAPEPAAVVNPFAPTAAAPAPTLSVVPEVAAPAAVPTQTPEVAVGVPVPGQGGVPTAEEATEMLRELIPDVPAYDSEVYAAGDPNDPGLLHRIFSPHPALQELYHAARGAGRYTPPMALLMIELLKVAQLVGPETATDLGAVKAGEQGDVLSLYTALVGRSGQGKSTASDHLFRPSLIAREGHAANIDEGTAESIIGKIVVGAASGQNVVDAFLEETPAAKLSGAKRDDKAARDAVTAAEKALNRAKGDNVPAAEKALSSAQEKAAAAAERLDVIAEEAADPTPRMKAYPVATFVEDELSALAAKASTASSTLMEAYLSGWSCSPVGDSSRTNGDRYLTPRDGRFMMNLIGGIQPSRAESLIGRKARHSGLAQRLLFIELVDPWRHINLETGDYIDYAAVPVPASPVVLPPLRRPRIVRTPQSAHTVMKIQDMRAAVSTGSQDPAEELRTHENRNRVRIACLTALWLGEVEVSEELWEWSGWVMEHVRRSRAAVLAVLAGVGAAERQEEAEARKTAEKSAAVSLSVKEAAVRDKILAKVSEAGAEGITLGKVTTAVRPKDLVAGVVAEMLERGELAARRGARPGTQWLFIGHPTTAAG